MKLFSIINRKDCTFSSFFESFFQKKVFGGPYIYLTCMYSLVYEILFFVLVVRIKT